MLPFLDSTTVLKGPCSIEVAPPSHSSLFLDWESFSYEIIARDDPGAK